MKLCLDNKSVNVKLRLDTSMFTWNILMNHSKECRMGGCMVFNATFNNISVISWRSWWRKLEYPQKTTDLTEFR
jgi:hypothetical protein